MHQAKGRGVGVCAAGGERGSSRREAGGTDPAGGRPPPTRRKRRPGAAAVAPILGFLFFFEILFFSVFCFPVRATRDNRIFVCRCATRTRKSWFS